MKTSHWRLYDENVGQMNVDGVLLVSGRFEGFKCLRLQIRQVEVNENPPDPMVAGACLKLIEPDDGSLLNPMMGFGSGSSFLGLESPSKVGYSQKDGLGNL
ncbi:hypothetical protein DY000_02032807 [Brassica cretica]|uniref:Uncharacterized protein n=1 Tax=Brassica cretica TaxID=69181 RepID=A0ABQ7DXV7_BRACR|nr:hypothetical protein DY000_02032807 [Brassica cretica]